MLGIHGLRNAADFGVANVQSLYDSYAGRGPISTAYAAPGVGESALDPAVQARRDEWRARMRPPKGHGIGQAGDGTFFRYKLPTLKCGNCDRIFDDPVVLARHIELDHEDK